MTSQDYAELLALQGGRCAICRCLPRKISLAVDHDHRSGLVRGLLCKQCNHRLLGGAKERLDILRNAVAYLENPPASSLW